MSRTYKATGINLKSMPLGESDRLVTILTREFGLVRAVAAGSRKHQSRLGGRSGLFVVNDLLIAKGRSLDKITQAETLESYPKLGQDLKKLTASQYLAEMTLYQAFSDQSQEELFYLVNEHLSYLERSPSSQVLAYLLHAIFQFLKLAGVAPQVHHCCVTQRPLIPDFTNADGQVGFSATVGGTVVLEELESLIAQERSSSRHRSTPSRQSTQNVILRSQSSTNLRKGAFIEANDLTRSMGTLPASLPDLNTQLTAVQLSLLQQLTEPKPPLIETASLPSTESSSQSFSDATCLSIERILRQYTQYYFERPIRSAALIDTCFVSLPPAL